MKNFIDLILKVALAIAIVLTNLVKDEVINSIVILSLAFLTVVLVVFKFKVEPELKLQDKILDIISLLVIVTASVYIIYRNIIF